MELLLHDPFHVATRGRFDGQYGVATRGLIVCPDIVPRYAQEAIVESSDEPVAVVEPETYYAEIVQMDLLGKVTEESPTFKATVVELVPDLVATVDDATEMEAQVFDNEELGVVVDDGSSADVEESGTIGHVVDDDAEANVEDVGFVGSVEDEPPHC